MIESGNNCGEKPTAAVYTLGCKVNQFESAAMTRMLEDAGYHIVNKGEPADLTVINTCTVTHKADFEVRALIRRANRANPEGRTIVTGCLAQIRPEEIKDLPGVYLVIGQDLKPDIVKLLDDHGPKVNTPPPGKIRQALSIGYPQFDRTRAFFRIQDGCSAACAYCTIPRARGPNRSLSEKEVWEGLKSYKANGYNEVVLTGIHIGAWGLDFEPADDFTRLMQRIAAAGSEPRLRISSIEPNEVTDGLVDLIHHSDRFCNHLHLPLQSGSNRILEAMRRPYPAELFQDLVLKLKDGHADVCIGVDVLTGFPGEDECLFEETYSLLNDLPVSYLHVFPYSKRPRTLAANMPNQVPEKEKKKRVAALRAMSDKKRGLFFNSCTGLIRPTLIENARDRETGLVKGLTDNYISVLIPDPAPPGGSIKDVKLVGIDEKGRMHGAVG